MTDRRAAVRYRTTKRFVTHGMLLVLAAALYAGHWRWLRRLRNGVG